MQALAEDADIELQIFRRSMRLMGNTFTISVVACNAEFAGYCIDEAVNEIGRIERLLTTFNDASQVSDINRQAGIKPVTVDKEVYDLIERSVRISKLTQGAFDITYGSLDKKFWNFDIHMTSLPDRDTALNAVRLINYRNIILDPLCCSVFLKEKGMRIGFGGIGKGYAAERARALLKKLGVHSGIVNASGDLAVWGKQPGGKPWTIGIADPEHRDKAFSMLQVSDMAIATSGSYEKFAVIDGKKYAHTIDPKTGFPVSGIKSATVICPNAEIADAMATPVIVMGIKPALSLINQLKDIACIIIDDEGRLYTSDNIKISS